MVVASLFTSELAAAERVEKVIVKGRSASIVTHRRLQEFFKQNELEEMQEPGYFDEVEEILKEAPS